MRHRHEQLVPAGIRLAARLAVQLRGLCARGTPARPTARSTRAGHGTALGSVSNTGVSSRAAVAATLCAQRHHVAQTLCILNSEGCNVFNGLSKSDYSRALDFIRDIILATDLAHHLRILKQLKGLAQSASRSRATWTTYFDAAESSHWRMFAAQASSTRATRRAASCCSSCS